MCKSGKWRWLYVFFLVICAHWVGGFEWFCVQSTGGCVGCVTELDHTGECLDACAQRGGLFYTSCMEGCAETILELYPGWCI